jgi:putative FmdB family regulatory protein
MEVMTTYVYKCTKCGKKFEEIHLMSERPVATTCPDEGCGGEATRYMGRGGITSEIHFIGWDWSRKNLLDPESDDPRLDPAYFDDLLEDTDRGPKTFFATDKRGK